MPAEAPYTAASDPLVVLRDPEHAFAVWLVKHTENLGFALFASGIDQHAMGNESSYSNLVSHTSFMHPPRR